MKNAANQTGYTLVELLITVGVAAITLAAATPSLKEIYQFLLYVSKYQHISQIPYYNKLGYRLNYVFK